MMYDLVRQYTPQEWTSSGVRADVNQHSEEYKQLVFEVKQALNYSPTIRNIIRVQDLHSYGQFLIREQLLSNEEQAATLYKVRRYISVDKYYLSDVIKYNLDPRRCGKGQQLTFSSRLNVSNDSSKIICVVKVLTSNPHASEVTPSSSTEYYVEYIVEQ